MSAFLLPSAGPVPTRECDSPRFCVLFIPGNFFSEEGGGVGKGVLVALMPHCRSPATPGGRQFVAVILVTEVSLKDKLHQTHLQSKPWTHGCMGTVKTKECP